MKTDQLFHEFFTVAPQAVFELLQITPPCAYSYSAPVIKEVKEKRLDGLLKPAKLGYPHYFVELQGYEDRAIYWRTVHEIGAFHEQQPNLGRRKWRAVVLFLDESYDPGLRTLGSLNHGDMPWLIRGVIPDLLNQAENPSPVLNVLRPLIAKDEAEIKQKGAEWLDAMQQVPNLDAGLKTRLRKLFIHFILQKFTTLTWKEIETMLKLIPLDQTVVGQEFIRQNTKENTMDILRVRFGAVPKKIAEGIERQDKQSVLKMLHTQAVLADSLSAFEQALPA